MRLPFTRVPMVARLSSKFVQFQIRQVLADAEIIWTSRPDFLAHPSMFDTLMSRIDRRQKLIYDAIDDYLSFPWMIQHPQRRLEIQRQEQALIQRADVVFCPSASLAQRLTERYGSRNAIHLIPNGIEPTKAPLSKTLQHKLDGFLEKLSSYRFKAIYTGFIDEYLDTELILSSLERFEELVYVFFGPLNAKLPVHERVRYFGVVESELIVPLIAACDIAVLPYKKTALTRVLNNVKLYQYIASSKPVMAYRSDESHFFEPFVYVYDTTEQYLGMLNLYMQRQLPPKQSIERCLTFAHSNSWKARAAKIVEILNKVL